MKGKRPPAHVRDMLCQVGLGRERFNLEKFKRWRKVKYMAAFEEVIAWRIKYFFHE